MDRLRRLDQRLQAGRPRWGAAEASAQWTRAKRLAVIYAVLGVVLITAQLVTNWLSPLLFAAGLGSLLGGAGLLGVSWKLKSRAR